MTLNTFHFAGRGEMNVTLGIPRLRKLFLETFILSFVMSRVANKKNMGFGFFSLRKSIFIKKKNTFFSILLLKEFNTGIIF